MVHLGFLEYIARTAFLRLKNGCDNILAIQSKQVPESYCYQHWFENFVLK